MALLIGIAFAAGLVTALSPCVLPVLPVLLAGGAAGGTRRPYAIVAGLVLSFTIFTITAAALLDALGLPQDLLRNVAVGLLVLAGLAIAIPPLGDLIRRPLLALTRRRPGDLGGGFVLGLALGLVFVAAALAIGFDVTRPLQTFLPGYTEAVQDRFERSADAQQELTRLTGATAHETSSL